MIAASEVSRSVVLLGLDARLRGNQCLPAALPVVTLLPEEQTYRGNLVALHAGKKLGG